MHHIQLFGNLPLLFLLAILTAIPATSQAQDWCLDETREINNYPEYGAVLDEGQRTRLKGIAAAIVRSRDSGTPILSVKIIGHADRALRLPEGQRAAKEKTVSEQRGEQAKEQLTAELKKLPGGTQLVSVIADPVGVGASNLKVNNPGSEIERRQNRRVIFQWSRCMINPVPPNPPPHDLPDDPNNVPAGQHFRMKVLDGVEASGPAYGISHYTLLFWDVDNHRAAEYTYPAVIKSKGIPPFTETEESDWSEVFTTSKFVQVDQLGGLASHKTGSLFVTSGMLFEFTSKFGTSGKTGVYTGPSKSIGVEEGGGPFMLIQGTVHVFNGQ